MNDNTLIYGILLIVYFIILMFLGYKGYRGTKTAADYMVGGRKIHPAIMALSYGATFISTSGIIGFGGFASSVGMGLLWICFLNLTVGVLVAFIIFGKRTRAMSHRLNSHTFAEFLGNRFQSRFIQGFIGLLIFLLMPIYTAAVLMGAASFLQITFGLSYDIALIFFTAIVALYVLFGGLKGVMFTDAFQGGVMLISMIILIFMTYTFVDSLPYTQQNYGDRAAVVSAHQALEDLTNRSTEVNLNAEQVIFLQKLWQENHLIEPLLQEYRSTLESILSHTDIDPFYLHSTERMIEALELLRNADTTILTDSNNVEKIDYMAEQLNQQYLLNNREMGWTGFTSFPQAGSSLWWVLFSSLILGIGIGILAQPQLVVRFMTVKSDRELHRGVLIGGIFIFFITAGIDVVAPLSNVFFFSETGLLSMTAVNQNVKAVIPVFLKYFIPEWFFALFMITILSASMSTLSSQFHVMGTSLGRDFYEKPFTKHKEPSVLVNRIGIAIAILFSLLLAWGLPKWFNQGEAIIARATAMFFSLCACSFLPMYIAALFAKSFSSRAVILGMITGFGAALFWILFVHEKESALFGLSHWLTAKSSLFDDSTAKLVDPILVGLPISLIFTLMGRLIFPASNTEIQHAEQCLTKH